MTGVGVARRREDRHQVDRADADEWRESCRIEALESASPAVTALHDGAWRLRGVGSRCTSGSRASGR